MILSHRICSGEVSPYGAGVEHWCRMLLKNAVGQMGQDRVATKLTQDNDSVSGIL